MGTRRRGSHRAAPGRALEDPAGRAPGSATGEPATGESAEPEPATRDPETTAREICLRLLTIEPKTRAQLAAALRRRGVPESVAEHVLGRFTETGLIDDNAFANAWVESRHYGRGLSRRALAAELHQRGVADDDIRHAIGKLDPEQEEATARQIVARKLAATRGQPAPVRTRRLAGMLARKGYPAGLVFRIVREALEQEGTDAARAGLDDAADASVASIEAIEATEAVEASDPMEAMEAWRDESEFG